MRRILKITGILLATILTPILFLGGAYLINPDGFQEKIYNTFYPQVKNTEAFAGKITVENPEVYELMWIACSLTAAFRQDDNVTSRTDEAYADYQTAVEAHFGEFQDHPLVKKLDEYLEPKVYDLNHFAIRFQSLNYEIDTQDRLRKTGDYRISPILTKAFAKRVFLVSENRQLINDFIQTTDFTAFYESNQDEYEARTNNFEQLTDLPRMWEWLEARYPNRIASYRILASPMTGGFHNTAGFDGPDGFHQALMFVSTPTNIDLSKLSDTARIIQQYAYSRIVFTEIDHNYVNPFSERYRQQIYAAIPDITIWNSNGDYGNAMSTFNEYMTFGMYALFAQEQFEGSTYDFVMQKLESMMDDYRRFHRFPEFNQELIRYHETLDNKLDMAPIYEHMIDWMGKQEFASLAK